MIKKRRLVVVAPLALATTCISCSTSKISSVTSEPRTHSIDKIAVALHGGVLGEALIRELRKQGFAVLDIPELYHLLERMGINDINEGQPANLMRLRSEDSVDVYVTSTTNTRSVTGQSQSATIKAFSTHTGRVIVTLEWENGWAGLPGSPADHDAKKNADEAAREITSTLIRYLR